MDTVEEENSPLEERAEMQQFILRQNSVKSVHTHANPDRDEISNDNGALSSRRPSLIIDALRRPSQAFALSAAHAVMNQRRYFMGLFHNNTDSHVHIEDGDTDKEKLKKLHRKVGGDALTTILSALYAKLMVVLGIAFPITETISPSVRPFYYQGFYLYLYLGSITFVAYMYLSLIREKAVSSILTMHKLKTKSSTEEKPTSQHGHQRPKRYGSFYLRLGAIAFGIGSMVYSGLEFGRYIELKNNHDCYSNVLQAVTPATRMILTLLQIQFIFLNSKDIELNRHKIVSRFGLMHMIATNLCEWLYVLVEETKHEIVHLGGDQAIGNTTDLHPESHCEGDVMGALVNNASPFLFPCTIEYSLICAVILYEMWKALNNRHLVDNKRPRTSSKKYASTQHDKYALGNMFNHVPRHSEHHISLDCSHAHKGLFAGILIIVLTIISLIMFFVLNKGNGIKENNISYKKHAEFEVNIVELILYIISTIAVIVAMIQMRRLKHDHKLAAASGLGLDITLLVVAQTGVFIYSMFSIIGCYFTLSENSSVGFISEMFSFIQTFLQTMFVLDGWWRRCRNLEQTRQKPGRELVTFLLIANMALWTINAMEKGKAEFRPTHIVFFGAWAWTIITHISMPLVIFYRFHSTICLFEIWKSAYKIKSPYAKHPLVSFL